MALRVLVRGIAAACGVALAGASSAGPPEEGSCPALSAPVEGRAVDDGIPMRLREGMILRFQNLLALQRLIPPEIWANREVFFYPGMNMVIGPCHRRYPVAEFYARATETFAGRAELDEQGNLRGYVAGLPFPPESIDLDTPDAATRWAWNLELRYRGAGPRGRFRIVDLAGALGSDQTYLGSFFLIQTGHRADRPESGYALPEANDRMWIAGGRFDEPTNARHLAWRQERPKKALIRHREADDTFVYVPTMRKTRRAASIWVDGTYMPRFRVSGDAGGGGVPMGGAFVPQGAINPTAAASIAVTEHLRRGFTTLALRPNAYVWRLRGEQEVIAPLNSAHVGYPHNPDRNFGRSGLSVADDRWDVRWAVVLDGIARERDGSFRTLTLYIDWQTQQPLYAITKRSRGLIADVGIAVHRFSGDVLGYPEWAEGVPANVFDPVAETFYAVPDDSGWRRETYGAISVPAEERERRRFLSTDYLMRGH